MRVILYGLGRDGKEFLAYLKNIDSITIVAVTDSQEDVRNSLEVEEQRKFKCVDDALRVECDYIVVSSSRFFGEIFQALVDRGAIPEKIISVDTAKALIPKPCFCNLCNHKIVSWNYFGNDFTLFQKVRVVGAGKRRGLCPVCGSVDRTRFVYRVLKDKTDLFETEGSVLHFAPEQQLMYRIKENEGIEYISADIEKGRADVEEDITKLSFQDASFDYIICNHILEHIENESAAFRELKRCLKVNGKLIITIPICWETVTVENIPVLSDEDRIRYYGQGDHVRLYGKDVIKRFEKYELNIRAFKSDELFDEKQMDCYGFIKGDMVLIAQK